MKIKKMFNVDEKLLFVLIKRLRAQDEALVLSIIILFLLFAYGQVNELKQYQFTMQL